MTALQIESQSIQLVSGPVAVVCERSPLATLLTRPAIAIPGGAPLADAVAVMEEAHVSALLVEPSGGVVTERDISRAFGHGIQPEAPVDAVATRHPIVVRGSMTVVEACAVMLTEDVRHLVVDTEPGWGIVSMRDLAAVLLQCADPQLLLASLRVAIDVPPEIWLG